MQDIKALKQERMRLMQFKLTKQGQIRAFNRQKYLANQEIDAEKEELHKLENQIAILTAEINKLSYGKNNS